MDKKVRRNALLWAGGNFLLIAGLVLLECLILRYTCESFLMELAKVNPGSDLRFMVLASIIFAALGTVFGPRFAAKKISWNLKNYKLGHTRPIWFGEILLGLCLFRKKTLPEVFILHAGGPLKNEHSIMAGILDIHGRRDQLLIGSGLFQMMSKEQLLGILAHELRHSNATENIIMSIGKAFRGVLIGIVLYVIVTQVTLGDSILALGLGFAVPTILGVWLKIKIEPAKVWSYFYIMSLLVIVPIQMIWKNPSLLILIALFFPMTLFTCFIIEQFASRAREYKTDMLAAMDMGTGRPLINALHHLETTMKRDSLPDRLRMFEFLKYLERIISSHPPIEKRIAVLDEAFRGHQKLRPELQRTLLSP
ncbi:MAG TPA: M48 family metalloprotease [Oligoflexia bacterium]|nr:M48 family metalloprotease [Oligoflexia bacterium]HMP47513.1 M48 family metalloprotease [Oligoflexia bacterium]